MKLVAVSQRVDSFPDRKETRDGLDQRLVVLLSVIGLVPIPIPNVHCINQSSPASNKALLTDWLNFLKPSGIILSGGNDIGSTPNRDNTEKWLCDYAKAKEIPALGICRGMQMMSMWAGVNLKKVSGHVGQQHSLTGQITGTVNSFHRFGIEACPQGFEIIAKSGDDEIEAIRNAELNWEGWMWHPEREKTFDAEQIKRLKSLFKI